MWQENEEESLRRYHVKKKVIKDQNPAGPLELQIGPSLDQQQRIAENQYHANMADRYFAEAKNAPGSGAWQAIKGAYHWWMSKPSLGGNSEEVLPPMIGMAPDVTPGKGVIKAARLASQAAKEDRVLGIGRKVKNQVKHGRGFDSGDARAVNSGQSRVQNSQIRLALEQMRDANYNATYASKLNKLQAKLAKSSNPEVQARINTEIRDLAKQFIQEGWLH